MVLGIMIMLAIMFLVWILSVLAYWVVDRIMGDG